MPPMITYLAIVIDLQEERLEKNPIPFLRTQIVTDLEKLFKRFEAEYQEFILTTGQCPTMETLRAAA